MATDNRILELIVKLTRLTTEGVIIWTISDATHPIIVGTDNIVQISFITEFQGKRIAIYQKRVPYFSGEYERVFWSELIVLAMLDEQNRVLWENSEESPALNNLFEVVREQSSGINDFIDCLLTKDNK